MNIDEIHVSLKNSDIEPGDTLLIHGDSVVAAQITEVPAKRRLSILFKEIIKYLGENGTLVIPTFTYSLTKNKLFDVNNTKSSIGFFSEYFRNIPGTVRSSHPIFSMSAIGKKKNLFKESNIEDCFGEKTAFDLLYHLNAKQMNLGCRFNLTFAHYVEQKFKVNYRYFKSFKGYIKINKKKILINTNYFVGDKKIKYKLHLEKLKKKLLKDNKLKIVPFGRLASYTVSSKNFFIYSKLILEKNPYGLIEEGN